MADASGPSVTTYRVFTGIAVAVTALVLLILQVTGGESAEGPAAQAGNEVLLQPVSSTGPDPFTAGLSSNTPPVVPGNIPELEVDVGGESVELFGGTGQINRCDQATLIQFLRDNPAKTRAFARVVDVSVSELPIYIEGLLPVILQVDTRVTNHGFSEGVATPFQAIMESGTAVLIDGFGVPRVRCECGNPLAPPLRLQDPVYVGQRWPGFNPRRVVQVPAPASSPRPSPPPSPSPSPAESPSPSPTPPAEIVNLSFGASATASSIFSGDYQPSLSNDGDKTTSWFSAGPGADGTTTWTLSLPAPATITRLEFYGNEQHPEFPTGFGFGHWTIDLIDGGGNSLHTIESRGSGITSQVHRIPSISGVEEIVLTGSSHESLECGGFSELWAFGSETA